MTFRERVAIDFSGCTQEKNGLTYIPWGQAWDALCSLDEEANYEVHLDELERPWHADETTAWVDVSVTAFGKTIRDYCFPLLDNRNQPIRPGDARLNSHEVNSAIQRCITKLIARHGVGLSVYKGEVTMPTAAPPSAAPSIQPAALRNRIRATARRNPAAAALVAGTDLAAADADELETLLRRIKEL